MSIPRLLLVSDVPLDGAQTGGIYLGDLCAMYPPDRLAVCVLSPDPRVAWASTFDGVARAVVRKPPERGAYRLGCRAERVTRPMVDGYVRAAYHPRVVRRIASLARRHHADIVWAPLAGTTTIACVAPAAAAAGARLLTTVWDPPEYFLAEHRRLEGRPLARYLEEFGEALATADGCGVQCETMRDEYAARYGARGVVMRHGVPRRRWCEARAAKPSGSELVVAYAGSLYADREWEALLDALDGCRWRVSGRDVAVHVYANWANPRTTGRQRVHFRGWREADALTEALASADVAYLPYWFDSRYTPAVRLSFPSKLSVYVAARVPVLFHGPRDSSPRAFLDRYPVGISCHSLEAGEILAALGTLASDEGLRARAAAAGRQALEDELGLHVYRRRFAELLGAPADALLPAA